MIYFVCHNPDARAFAGLVFLMFSLWPGSWAATASDKPAVNAAKSRTELRAEELIGPDGKPTMTWHRRQRQSALADPARASTKAIKAGLKESFHEPFNRPDGKDLGPGWTQAAHYGVVNEEIRNGRLRFEVLRSEGFPWGSATLDLANKAILGHGLDVGSYFEITVRRLSGQGDIGIELFDSDQLRVGGDLRSAPSPLQTWNGATWIAISFDQFGQPVSFDWDKVHTIGVRFDSADGHHASFSYYVDSQYAGSWLVATSQKSVDKIGVYIQSKEAGPVFECDDLRVVEKGR